MQWVGGWTSQTNGVRINYNDMLYFTASRLRPHTFTLRPVDTYIEYTPSRRNSCMRAPYVSNQTYCHHTPVLRCSSEEEKVWVLLSIYVSMSCAPINNVLEYEHVRMTYDV